jgi:hypothetical protein
MKTTTVQDYRNCILLESGRFSLAVTTHVGPRVIGGFVGGSANLFVVLPQQPMDGIATGFALYGGHRLWHAPEASPRTYAPDNTPVEVKELPGGEVSFSSGIEAITGIEKTIAIKPLGGEKFEVTHRLVNRNLWAVELAPWALSQMAPGGIAVYPQHRVPKANPFAVDRSLHFWPYSDLADPRFRLGSQYLFLAQDVKATTPFKLGYANADGWAAYVNGGVAFVKYFDYDADLTYPDHGCNVESYSCGAFLEVETLGPLELLQPDQEAVHVEVWHAFDGVGPVTTDAQVVRELLPRLSR